MEIKLDNLSGGEIVALLNEHMQAMHLHSPAESVHALDVNELRGPDIKFWSVWIDQKLAGCGALKKISLDHAEIKSMRTSTDFLRKGVAASLLEHILNEAIDSSFRRVSLETGSMAAFDPAVKLYLKFGFEYCEPFADYDKDPHSLFMTKVL